MRPRLLLAALGLAALTGGIVLALSQVLEPEVPAARQAAEERADAMTAAPPAPPPEQPPPTPPPPAPYVPHPEDVHPDAKLLAARVALALTTYPAGSSAREIAGQIVAEHGGDLEALAAAAGGLVDPAVASSGAIVYPTLGGLTRQAASVMVVVRQDTVDADGTSATTTRVLDVRLRMQGGAWAFDSLASDGGPQEARPAELSPAAQAVLDHPRIELPDSARWDIYRGQIDDGLLALMADIAERHHIAVAVLSTGHPWEVFGTDRQSNHSRGRAVDIYAVDGELVVAQRSEGTPAYRLARHLFDIGIPELGSPWAFDGFGGRSFTDVVHQDHLHIAIGPTRPG